MQTFSKQLLISTVAILLGGCGGTSILEEQDSGPSEHRDLSKVSNAVPRSEPRSRYGNPDSYVVLGKRYHVMPSSKGFNERGIASWYGTKFHGRRTSSGERYDMYAMTAAHKNLPLPTYVRVKNLKNQRTIIVKVNDRGPFHDNRIIDLSYAAAHKLDITRAGTGFVEITALDPGAPSEPATRLASRSIPETGDSGDISLFIQVGAFASRGNAERLLGQLLDAAVNNVRISQLINPDNTLYRVRIGPVANVGEADRLTQMLAQIGIHGARVVID